MFRVHQEDMRDCAEDRISFSDVLVVQFSTGATQVAILVYSDAATLHGAAFVVGKVKV